MPAQGGPLLTARLSAPALPPRLADELWRHLGQLGMERDDPDAAEPFGGRHPTKILESMEHGRSGQAATYVGWHMYTAVQALHDSQRTYTHTHTVSVWSAASHVSTHLRCAAALWCM